MNWEAFREQLARWHEEQSLLTPHAPWVVAVSGGPDSTLLLHALQDLSRQRQLGWKFHVAHMHHGLRGADADADAEFVEALARETGAKFHLERVSIPDEITENGGSAEELSRQRRYEFSRTGGFAGRQRMRRGGPSRGRRQRNHSAPYLSRNRHSRSGGNARPPADSTGFARFRGAAVSQNVTPGDRAALRRAAD